MDIKKEKKFFKNKLSSDDIIFFDFNQNGVEGFLIYVDSITDRELLGRLVLTPLSTLDNFEEQNVMKNILNANVESQKDKSKIIEKILEGYTALFISKLEKAILVDLKKFDVRAISEPPTSAVLKGPREGFNESIRTNLSMIRRRIKNQNLVIENMLLGKQSKTSISILYMSNIADNGIIATLKERINTLSIDNIPDSSYVARHLKERKHSLFRQIGTTEKPDVLSAKLMEGRIGIIVDGSPIALTVPYLFIEDFQSSEDYYRTDYKSNLSRILRGTAIIVAILLPAIFVSAQLFHLEFIPLKFLITIVNSIKGIPLSPSYEMLFTLIIFEFLNEASIRMPKYVGMALSIVGALVLGETAVAAGIVSSPTILIMALSGICLYTCPDLVDTMSILRFAFLIVAGTFGGYGLLISIALLLIYISSIDSFGIPFLSPYSPLVLKDLKDGIIMDNVANMKKRPISLKTHKNKVRMK